jgi:hypothetical protein
MSNLGILSFTVFGNPNVVFSVAFRKLFDFFSPRPEMNEIIILSIENVIDHVGRSCDVSKRLWVTSRLLTSPLTKDIYAGEHQQTT